MNMNGELAVVLVPEAVPINNDDYFNSFPAGYRFRPTDGELIVYYLAKRVLNQELPPNKIFEVELYQYRPETLAETYVSYQENQWYFFTPRDRKYPNGERPNRAAGDGYWKAAGADKSITHGDHDETVGFKKALVFYRGKAPHGEKTKWIMHEFRTADQPRRPRAGATDMRLDDWVLCRIYQKGERLERGANRLEVEDHEQEEPQQEEEAPSSSTSQYTPENEMVTDINHACAVYGSNQMDYNYQQQFNGVYQGYPVDPMAAQNQSSTMYRSGSMVNQFESLAMQQYASMEAQAHPQSLDMERSRSMVAQVHSLDMQRSYSMVAQARSLEIQQSRSMVDQAQAQAQAQDQAQSSEMQEANRYVNMATYSMNQEAAVIKNEHRHVNNNIVAIPVVPQKEEINNQDQGDGTCPNMSTDIDEWVNSILLL